MKKYNFKKTDIIADILDKREDAAEIFFQFGFHCIGCPASQMETVEEAAAVHGVDVEFLVKKLKEYGN